MGILTTLDAPSFRDEFLPDKYLLRALIYRDLCHYLPGQARREGADAPLRRLAGGHPRARGPAPRTRACAAPPRPTAPPSAPRASSSRWSWRASAWAATPAASATGSSRTSPGSTTWRTPRPTRVYDERAATRRCAQEADKLLRAAEQVRLMEYEVGLKLYERVKKGRSVGAARGRGAARARRRSPSASTASTGTTSCATTAFSLESRCIEETDGQ